MHLRTTKQQYDVIWRDISESIEKKIEKCT